MGNYFKNTSKLYFILIALLLLSCGKSKYEHGERIYKNLCSNCHIEDGSGLGTLIPSLNSGKFIKNPEATICKIIEGYNADSIGHVMRVMPSFSHLSNVEMANLVNYLNFSWGNPEKYYNIKEITDWVDVCKNN